MIQLYQQLSPVVKWNRVLHAARKYVIKQRFRCIDVAGEVSVTWQQYSMWQLHVGLWFYSDFLKRV